MKQQILCVSQHLTHKNICCYNFHQNLFIGTLFELSKIHPCMIKPIIYHQLSISSTVAEWVKAPDQRDREEREKERRPRIDPHEEFPFFPLISKRPLKFDSDST